MIHTIDALRENLRQLKTLKRVKKAPTLPADYAQARLIYLETVAHLEKNPRAELLERELNGELVAEKMLDGLRMVDENTDWRANLERSLTVEHQSLEDIFKDFLAQDFAGAPYLAETVEAVEGWLNGAKLEFDPPVEEEKPKTKRATRKKASKRTLHHELAELLYAKMQDAGAGAELLDAARVLGAKKLDQFEAAEWVDLGFDDLLELAAKLKDK